MGLAEFLTIAINVAVFLKDYPLIISIVLLVVQVTRNSQTCRFVEFFNIKPKKITKVFDPDELYTKRPVIEFTPMCFVQSQENVDLFVASIQKFIDSKIVDRVHLITYNFVPLTNIDIYFIRAIDVLLDNAIYDNNGLLISFIFKAQVTEDSLISEMQTSITSKVDEAIKQKRIQPDTIQIKKDERKQERIR